jgi:hypothetical protein
LICGAQMMGEMVTASCSNSTRSRSSSRSGGGGTSSNSSLNTHNLVRESLSGNPPLRVCKHGSKNKRCLSKRAKRPSMVSTASGNVVCNENSRLAATKLRSSKKRVPFTASRYVPVNNDRFK